MNARQAIARLAKLTGRNTRDWAWRENPHGLDHAARAAARERIPALRDALVDVQNRRAALRDQLLAVPEYQALLTAERDAKAARDEAVSASHRFKLTVGRALNGFFHVMYQGDNWADVVKNAEDNNPAGAS